MRFYKLEIDGFDRFYVLKMSSNVQLFPGNVKFC